MQLPWRGFDEIIDVRSPREYAEDCIPGAVNLPALSNAEHAEIGILYKSSPFAARLRGAGLLASNIAAHLQNHFATRPPQWRPLIYCRRGGQRSGAVVEVLCRIGWQATALCGGYKRYRQTVLDGIAAIAPTIRWAVIGGKTGAGKTAMLQILRNNGQSIIDLESLGNHRGSVFGGCGTQPAQRRFESVLFDACCAVSPSAPVFVEAESRKIGLLHMPQPLLAAIRQAPVFYLQATIESRARRIVADYETMKNPAHFAAALSALGKYAAEERKRRWQQMHDNADWTALAQDLLGTFYDVGYQKSLSANYGAPAAYFKLNPTCVADLQQTAPKISQQAALLLGTCDNIGA